MKLDLKLLIATAIAGFAGFLSVQALYTILVDAVAKPVLIAILMTVFALICCAIICAVVILTTSTEDEFLFLYSRGMILAGLAVCTILLFLFTMLFEWIYDHEEIKSAGASSYIFILDESGSMETNDPDCQRYEAVESVVNRLLDDVPYAVYMFSDDCVRIRDMAPASAGTVKRPADVDRTMGGRTFISNALTVVYDDLESGNTQGGDHPQVLLLTDGYASDMGWLSGKSILNDYKKAGIAVSTVGLGEVDEALLSEIADKTKGQYVLVSDASQLAQGFANVTYQSTGRDLISRRSMLEKDGLYLFLRILFLTLIGTMVAFMKAMACAGSSTALILAEGAVAALVAAIIMEIGLSLGAPVFLCRLVYWMALAITPQMLENRISRSSGSSKVKTAEDILRGSFSSSVE